MTKCNSQAVRVCLLSGFCFLGRLVQAALRACAATLDLIVRGSNGEPTMLHNIGVVSLCICTAK